MNIKDIIIYTIVLIILMALVIIAINTKFYVGFVFFVPMLIIWCIGVIAIVFKLCIKCHIHLYTIKYILLYRSRRAKSPPAQLT